MVPWSWAEYAHLTMVGIWSHVFFLITVSVSAVYSSLEKCQVLDFNIKLVIWAWEVEMWPYFLCIACVVCVYFFPHMLCLLCSIYLMLIILLVLRRIYRLSSLWWASDGSSFRSILILRLTVFSIASRHFRAQAHVILSPCHKNKPLMHHSDVDVCRPQLTLGVHAFQ